MVMGSHDILMDVLADLIKKHDYRLELNSSNVGSMGGIIAVSRGYAHMGGTHLLDSESGEYNVPYIEKITKDYVLVNMSYRTQGLIVQKGNPKGIRGIEDLARKDIRFINRQKSSGTRVLLDYLLKKSGVRSEEISGYEVEEISHMNLAVKIKYGMADVGMGIEAVARILDLDFIPVAKERYDLILSKDFSRSDVFETIIEILRSDEFRKIADEIGGYDLSDSGKVIIS
jgi:putative molybdopterin biosynthesis protein